MKASQVNIMSAEAPNVMVCGDALQETVGIAPLIDERPLAEKAGGKPHGIFLLLWNQRIGNYVSGSKDFLDPVEVAMPEQIGRSISRSNCFIQTKVLKSPLRGQPTPEDLLLTFAKEQVRYVLISELKHFYGEQRQKAYFYALPAYFVDLIGSGNEIGPAQGHTEMIVTLYDAKGGSELFKEKILGEANSSISGAYPKVARDSFIDASEKIANQLYRYSQLQQGSVMLQPEK
jgi:hypothetical protein